ncbi:hypothetical protein [Tumebacillus permanentifrigoris]|uniref:Secreted protein n=1 Tax=Tumebacillus permanentifrigoris TaxID=378543 RepID=A0A316DAR1_9BACL|nr:hypothetical protein [Tumebacillus permanentifrigoris]PWK14418.1 hypothetical protein C7459_105176 [Tumebacillus permanentifrigoris]
MKRKLWMLALIGILSMYTVPTNALAENEPPTWDPCSICPPRTGTTATTTEPVPACPETPPTPPTGDGA